MSLRLTTRIREQGLANAVALTFRAELMKLAQLNGRDITGIDISPKMLEKAKPRVAAYDGQMTARLMDVHDMDFADGAFDQVYSENTGNRDQTNDIRHFRILQSQKTHIDSIT